MKHLYVISLVINFIMLATIVVLFLLGKPIIKKIIREKIIEVRHNQLKSMFENCPISLGSIIFLGDSITEGGNWSELFPGQSILNRGIGGDITSGILARIDEVVRHQPSKIFICIGTNDLAFGLSNAEILKNYRAIIDKIQKESPQTIIYVQSVLPVGKKVLAGHDNLKILPLNVEIKKMCDDLKLSYIDLDSVFKVENGYLKSEYTNDNLHLLGAGYLAWKEKIGVYVNEK